MGRGHTGHSGICFHRQFHQNFMFLRKEAESNSNDLAFAPQCT
jgi:hypothetical protein